MASHLILILLVLLTIYPLFFLLNVSAKDRLQFESNPLVVEWPRSFENFAVAWNIIQRSLINNIVITVASLAAMLTTSAITAYVFARYSFPGKEVLWYGLLGLLMIPGILTLVPLLVLVTKTLALNNTLWAVILPYTAGGQMFTIFLMRTFFAQLPEELFEAARLDGASHLGIIGHLVIPLSMPILIVNSMLHILHCWNDIAWPLLVLYKPELRTVALQLLQFQGAGEMYPAAVYAGSVIAMAPIAVMFAFGTRQFISGVLAGALKM
jgi:multiple sugar transport system permease protein/raffinose/stachyose/melibiose transport system permease protein